MGSTYRRQFLVSRWEGARGGRCNCAFLLGLKNNGLVPSFSVERVIQISLPGSRLPPQPTCSVSRTWMP